MKSLFTITVFLSLMADAAIAQSPSCNPPYPYEFCTTDAQGHKAICTHCSSSPTTEKDKPVKRASIIPGCISNDPLYSFLPDAPGDIDVQYDFKPLGQGGTVIPVFKLTDEGKDVSDALSEWTNICGPQGNQTQTSYCPKYSWVEFKSDFDALWDGPLTDPFQVELSGAFTRNTSSYFLITPVLRNDSTSGVDSSSVKLQKFQLFSWQSLITQLLVSELGYADPQYIFNVYSENTHSPVPAPTLKTLLGETLSLLLPATLVHITFNVLDWQRGNLFCGILGTCLGEFATLAFLPQSKTWQQLGIFPAVGTLLVYTISGLIWEN